MSGAQETTPDLTVLSQGEVEEVLAGQERRIVELVREAYVTHQRQQSSLPHSSFLRFPGSPRDRIIALPAYLGGDFEVAGLKWIASFPGNLERGLARASAVIILNSMRTGRPRVILEGGLVSATRTAASAVLAAVILHPQDDPAVGLVGGGRINFEIVHYLRTLRPEAHVWRLFDLDAGRARGFAERCREVFSDLEVVPAESLEEVLASSTLVSFATTATEPYLGDLSVCPPGATVLHISLRDLTPEAILAADNVVDDVDHVCRAGTSVHLTEQRVGHRDFVRCPLGAILTGEAAARPDPRGVTVFSPFGLGILDLAVARWVAEQARERGLGREIGDFFLPG